MRFRGTPAPIHLPNTSAMVVRLAPSIVGPSRNSRDMTQSQSVYVVPGTWVPSAAPHLASPTAVHKSLARLDVPAAVQGEAPSCTVSNIMRHTNKHPAKESVSIPKYPLGQYHSRSTSPVRMRREAFAKLCVSCLCVIVVHNISVRRS